MNTTLATRSIVGIAGIALAVTACGGAGSGGTGSGSGGSGGSTRAGGTATATPAPTASATAATTGVVTETAAASLRAGLDALLHEHVDLTANAVALVTANGRLDDPEVQGALAALDQNTQDLGRAIGSLYGSSAQRKFVRIWRAHIGFFVTYVKGDLTHDSALKAKANRELDGYRHQFGAFVAGATGGALPASAVATELTGHVRTLEAAIDAITSTSPDAAAKVEMAAVHMDGTAAALAGGIAKAKNLAGDANGAGAQLRAGLTGLLVQHVAQTGAVVQEVVRTGSLADPAVQGAIQALDDNTKALGQAIGSVYGASAQRAFVKLWRAHIGFFVTYTKGDLTHDAALKAKANRQLDGYRHQFGAFVARATDNTLTAGQVAQDLTGHVQTLEAAIDAITSKATNEGARLSMAEQHMTGTAEALARAIASTQRATFTS